jgi:gas vesicle protein
MKDSNAGSNLVFFLLGASVGAAVALLYAPQEGEATRRLLGEKATDVKDKASELSHTVASATREKWDAAADKTRELLHRGKENAHETIDAAAESAHSTVESA